MYISQRARPGLKATKKVDKLLARYPSLTGFYSAKDKDKRALPRRDREEAAKLLDLIIKIEDAGELIR